MKSVLLTTVTETNPPPFISLILSHSPDLFSPLPSALMKLSLWKYHDHRAELLDLSKLVHFWEMGIMLDYMSTERDVK